MTASSSAGSADRPAVAVVTATHDRRALLPRLYESLLQQEGVDFTWVVVDDASTDDTWGWLEGLDRGRATFPIVTLRNPRNRGKCASLNTAFDVVDADFHLVVDSDDALVPGALETVRRKALEYDHDGRVGAVFFAYRGTDGCLLGGPPGSGDTVATRAEYDQAHGKYDGCVGYFRRVTETVRYPEFPPETYMGPTVLQMLMAPRFQVAFTAEVVGVAEYQAGGLSASGRGLRLANPLGMMTYARLRAEQGSGFRSVATASAMYHAYSKLAGSRARDVPSPRVRRTARLAAALGRPGGWVLARYWTMKFGAVSPTREDVI